MIIWTLAFLFPVSTCAQQRSLETEQTVEMIRGLKARRMFDLADQYATSQLESERIPRIEKITVLNELIRSKVVQAASLTGEERKQTWDRAHRLVRDYLDQDSDHPQKLLLQVQDALTHYSHGNLIAQEIAAEIQSVEQKAAAIQQFRQANKLFVTIEKEIDKQIPIARSREASPGELTEDQLVNLKNNVRYQLARIDLARAQMYEPDDKLNRIDALQQVLTRLNELIRQTNSDVPLWWRAQTSRIQCLRLMNRLEQAISVFKNLPDEELTDGLKSGLLTEQILIAAEKGSSSNELLKEVTVLPRPDPQLSLAVLKWLMASASKANGTAKTQLQQQAAGWVTQIENQHGPYWGRRAEILLVGSIKPAVNDSNIAQGDFQILVRQAENAFRKGNHSDAARAFAKASSFAQQNNRLKETVYLTVREAQCYENLKDHAHAANRLTEIANQYPDQTNAASIHLRGCWNFDKTVLDNPDQKLRFAEHLKRQATVWPEAEPSNQARIWLGDHYQLEKKWEQAIRAYLDVQSVSSKFLTAAEQISATSNRWLSSVEQSKRKEISQQVGSLIDGKLNFNSGPKDNWTEPERLLLLEWLDSGLFGGALSAQDGLELLNSATSSIGDDQLDWQRKALARRVVLLVSANASMADLEPLIRQLPTENSLLKELILLMDDVTTSQQQNQYANLAITICDKALSIPNLAGDLSFWHLRKAKSAIVSGRADEVLADLESLASENPKSLQIQLAYGRVLSQVPDQTTLAIKQWRKLATKVKKGTDAWYESKFNVTKLLLHDGKSEEANKLVAYLKATSPGWPDSGWDKKFERLLSDQ